MTTVRIIIMIMALGLGAVLPLIPLTVASVSAMENSDCLGCHGEEGFSATRDGHEVSLFVSEEGFAGSIHGVNGVGCTECHVDATDSHPDVLPDLQPVDCSGCHDEAAAALVGSVHASRDLTGGKGARCQECHGSHDILSKTDPKSRVYPLNIPDTCGSCHAHADIVGQAKAVNALYEQGQHGISTRKGMLGAAICTDCHGGHHVVAVSDSASPANPKNIVATCGKCHAGTVAVYKQSVHGMARGAGSELAPTCGDCHNPHATDRVDREEFLLNSMETCGGCHHEAMVTYRASYHGQITGLGFTRNAKCVNCHGAHAIQPSGNPASLTSVEKRLGTCQQCHTTAQKNFIGFSPHLDHSNKEKFPVESAIFGVMGALLINVFLLFSVHTLLWFIRAMFEKLKKEAPPHLGNPSGRYFLRFNFYQRITHFLIFTSFVTLSVTGLPLKFHDYAWAKMLAHLLGGFEVAGVLHRMMGAVTFGYFAMHLAYIAYLAISGRMRIRDILWGPRSIVPQPNDAVEIATNFKWFLGLGPRPKFGRFTYWEKFDYLAVFWGVAIIGLSGLVLWFPELTTRLLPGMVVNIAWIIHADEALLATGFIFLIHFYR